MAKRTVHPDLERAMAKRMGATTYELDTQPRADAFASGAGIRRDPNRGERGSSSIHICVRRVATQKDPIDTDVLGTSVSDGISLLSI